MSYLILNSNGQPAFDIGLDEYFQELQITLRSSNEEYVRTVKVYELNHTLKDESLSWVSVDEFTTFDYVVDVKLIRYGYYTQSKNTETGIPFTCRLVQKGDSYGAYHSLIADKPMVEFYDVRYKHTPLGQFVSRYNLDTMLEHEGGLNLDGGIPNWSLCPYQFIIFKEWLKGIKDL